MQLFRSAAIPSALLLLLLLVGCGGGSDQLGESTAGATVDPCSLIDPRTIDEITGWDIPAGDRSEETEQDGQDVCTWQNPELTGLVQVQVHPGAGQDLFDRRRDELESRHGLDAATDVEVPGADAAYEQSAHHLVGMRVGEHFVQVTTLGEPLDEAQHVALSEVVAGSLR